MVLPGQLLHKIYNLDIGQHDMAAGFCVCCHLEEGIGLAQATEVLYSAETLNGTELCLAAEVMAPKCPKQVCAERWRHFLRKKVSHKVEVPAPSATILKMKDKPKCEATKAMVNMPMVLGKFTRKRMPLVALSRTLTKLNKALCAHAARKGQVPRVIRI
mmetsp:Transcript_76273/g.145166  ORF Transcript_76273/g.145166 Transcript_76273/m.145166 type:complete len:159 (+) Transcript_76273:1008-1484(+)